MKYSLPSDWIKSNLPPKYSNKGLMALYESDACDLLYVAELAYNKGCQDQEHIIERYKQQVEGLTLALTATKSYSNTPNWALLFVSFYCPLIILIALAVYLYVRLRP